MRSAIKSIILGLVLGAPLVYGQARAIPLWHGERRQALQPEAEQLLALANQARAAHGAGSLKWDPALAQAAREHCLRMAEEGPISHQYRGEPEVSERAGQAGAHFSLIEENVAIGPDPAAIHDEWMHSAGHRKNLLNPDVDRMGAALVVSRGVLYAVADYDRAVSVLSPGQVENEVAGLLREQGIVTFGDREAARAYCERGQRVSGEINGVEPRFRMLWQNSDVGVLPGALMGKLNSRAFRKAAVGSCPAQNVEGAFTAYRVAVLLY